MHVGDARSLAAEEPTGFVARVCDDDGRWNPLPGLRTSFPVDYIGYGSTLFFGDFPATLGVPCATAREPVGCLARFHAARKATRTASRCTASGCNPTLVSTRGDEVLAANSLAVLLPLILPIDTEDEAVLVAEFAGFNVACAMPHQGGVRPRAGGFEVRVSRTRYDCERDHLVLAIDEEGHVREVASAIPPHNPHCLLQPLGLAR